MTPSVRADNRFRFHCPVVGRDEAYLACAWRRHRKWRGESVDCGGCAAAMNANKCPVVHMIEMECPRHEPARPIFFDPKGDKLYGLPQAVAARIEKVLVLPFHCRGLDMTPELHERLTGTREPAPSALPAASITQKALPPDGRQERRKTDRSTAADRKGEPDRSTGDLSDLLGEAQIDMAAALNAARA